MRHRPCPILLLHVVLYLSPAACGDPADKQSDDASETVETDAEAADSAPADVAPGDAAPDPVDAAPEVVDKPDVVPDIAAPDKPDGCVASCMGADGQPKVCGPDGCGSVCGFCKNGEVCLADGSKCELFCKPDCEAKGKKCGDNGCGGSCGTCKEKFHCGDDFLCHQDDCVGSCAGKECGDDGCGKSCGTCAAGDLCGSAGTCKPGPCKGIPAEGKCEGEILVTCSGQGATAQKVYTDCAADKDKSGKTACGYDVGVQGYACIVPKCDANCLKPDGTQKQCGDDGCGKPCGAGCPDDKWQCSQGTCIPQEGAACGSLVTQQGKCIGDQWWFCNTGSVAMYDCGKYGMKCQWNGAKFECK